MKTLHLLSICAIGIAYGLASSPSLAQQAPQTIQITNITGNNNNQQLSFNRYTGIAPLTEVELILNLTSISFNAQIDGTGGTPHLTLDDTLGLNNNQPPNLVNIINFIAPAPLIANTQGNYFVSDPAPTAFTSSILLTNNLSNFTQSNFSDSVQNQLAFGFITGATFDATSNVDVTGSVELVFNPQAVPEPYSCALGSLAMVLLVYLRTRAVKA
jgi:hypothetical protein